MYGGSMGKCIEVREFDSITENHDFKNDEKYKYVEPEIFQCLKEFIEKFSVDDESSDIEDFMKISYKRNIGSIISVKNYVGVIQMKNGTQIQVLPKINFGTIEDEHNKQTKRIFLNMLKSMREFPGKIFNNSHLKVEHMNLYEIFISMYLQELRKLVKSGIKSSYINYEDNHNFFKGKLLINQHIKKNFIHKEKFYVTYEEYHPNRPENKLIKSTLLKLQSLSTSAVNFKEIRQLLSIFDIVQPSLNYSLDFSKVQIDRNTKDYQMLMKWSRVFLFDKSFSTFSGETSTRALLFPMERVFESYISKQIKKILLPDGWQVSTQDKGHYLFTKPKECFALKPDIVCERDGRKIIIDTKWKNIDKSEKKNLGISQSDMYQMYAYSKKYQTSDVWLIYPINDKMRGHSDIIFESGDGTIVRVYFVDLENIDKSIEILKNKL